MPFVDQYQNLLDIQLVELARTKDALAYSELFHRFDARICTYLARMVGDSEVGRDLAQETFIKAWQSLPRLSGEVKFQAWLYTIASNVAKDYLRWKRMREWLPWTEHETSMNNISGLEKIEDQEILVAALMQLPFKQRLCVIMQIVEERPQREIAALLGINESSVSTYVRRGLEKLRQLCLAQYEGGVTKKGRVAS